MNEVEAKWFGWIPTNKGRLNFDFIGLPYSLPLRSKNTKEFHHGDKIEYTNLDISYLSDSYIYRKYLKKRNSNLECPAIANVELENEITKIQGKISIVYEGYCRLNTKFLCDLNGVVEFENISFDLDTIENDLQENLQEIKTLFYILLKTIIHGDAHHHQKIDVALPIVDNEFKPFEISSSLLNYIKLVERNIKVTNKCISFYRSTNLAFEIDGYLSYFESFTLIFKNDEQVKNDFEFAKCVIKSLKSTVGKRKNKDNFRNGLVTAFIAFSGLVISINILLNGFWDSNKNNIALYLTEHNRFFYFIGSVLIIFSLFFKYFFCKIRSLIYYNHYNFFDFAFFIKNADFCALNWKGKIIKLIPAIVIVIGVFLIFCSNNYCLDIFCQYLYN